MWVNFHFSNLIVLKLMRGWEFSNGIFNLVYAKNTGAAFSMMEGSTSMLILLSFFALIGILYYIARNIDNLMMRDLFCSAILISGIFGNFYERLHFGYVRDFFEFAFVDFPVFNISDVFINVGVFAIIVLILINKKPMNFI